VHEIRERAVSAAFVLGLAILPGCRVGYDAVSSGTAGVAGEAGGSSASQDAATGSSGNMDDGGVSVTDDSEPATDATSADVAVADAPSGLDVIADAAIADVIATDGCGPAMCASACAGYLYGGHAFAFCDSPNTRDQAVALCASMGMRLARIDDAAQNGWVVSIAYASLTGPIWIGADDLTTAGEFYWSDGTHFWTGGATGGAVGGAYNNWVNGSPRDRSCVYVGDTGLWFVTKCTANLRALCELY